VCAFLLLLFSLDFFCLAPLAEEEEEEEERKKERKKRTRRRVAALQE
jgi:hypothetical protein